jgi:hypothetical protein
VQEWDSPVLTGVPRKGCTNPYTCYELPGWDCASGRVGRANTDRIHVVTKLTNS